MKKLIYILITVVFVSACTENKQSTLDNKKKELVKYNEDLEALKTKIAALEKEIILLDTAKSIAKPKLVAVETLKSSYFKHFIDIQGNIESLENVMVGSTMGGQVVKVNVKEGDVVSAGQVLAETDSRIIRESLAQLETNYQFAKTTFERQQRLWDQKIGSEIQYLQAKTQFEGAEKSKASLQAQLDMSRIKSPIGGVVDMVGIKMGEVAPPGMGVFRVVNTNRMKLVARLADSYLNYVKPNDPVKVLIRETGDTINANISFISKSVNVMNRTFTIEADLKNLPSNVRPNMIANVSINDKNLDNALVINSNIVQRDQAGQNFVLVSEKVNGATIAKKKMVKIGLTYRDKVVIEEGLKQGDQIITTGYQETADGQTLMIN